MKMHQPRLSKRARNGFAALFLLALLLSPPGVGFAQEYTDIKDMTLEELLNLEVKAATKTPGFTVSSAPSVIRVFTRSSFEEYGFETLRDVLTNVPGIQVQEYRAAHQTPWFRGVKSRYNNKVLWLIDGVPVRDSYYGHNDIDEMIPLDMVERIEIVSGPGSVLYGANAFAGVVSIVTRKAQQVGKGERAARLRYGSYDTPQGALEFSHQNLYAYANYLTSSGFAPTLNADGKAWSHPQDANRTYALVKFGPENLEGTFSFTDYRYADKYRDYGKDRFWTRMPTYGSLQYRKDLGPQGHLSLLGYFESYPLSKEETKYKEPGVVTSATQEILDTSLYGVDLDFDFAAGKHALVAGTSLQVDQADDIKIATLAPTQVETPGLAVPDVRRERLGVFLQDTWSLAKSLDLTAGIRYDALSDFDDQLSYRAGLTVHKDRVYGKLLVGTAFRVPMYREYLDAKSFNNSLQPEHLTTLEAQIGSRFSQGDVNLTFFHNQYDDLIKELFVDSIREGEAQRVVDDEYSINADTSSITGVELQTTLHPRERLSLNLGAAAIFSAKETIGALDPSIVMSIPTVSEEIDSFFLSDFTTNALVSYRFSRRNHRVGLNAIYFSDRRVPPGYQSKVPPENRNPANADGFVKLDVFTTLRLFSKVSLNLKVRNLLDGQFYSPPIDDPAKYDIEWPTRSFKAELVFRY